VLGDRLHRAGCLGGADLRDCFREFVAVARAQHVRVVSVYPPSRILSLLRLPLPMPLCTTTSAPARLCAGTGEVPTARSPARSFCQHGRTISQPHRRHVASSSSLVRCVVRGICRRASPTPGLPFIFPSA
jgi:hypothetical protein